MMRLPKSIVGGVAGTLAILGLCVTPALGATPETPLTQPATSVTATTAILHGQLNPHGAGEPGQFQFYYRASTEACRPEAESSPEPPGTALGNEKEAVQVEVTGLHPFQTYEFCLIADPESFFIEGPSVSFKTLASKPSIFPETTKATAVTPFAATLGAEVNPNNEQTTYSIEYAQNELLAGAKVLPGASPLEAEYGERNASVGTGNVLTPETTYYFRVTATNAAGTVEGPIEHFTTPKAEAPIVISENVSALLSSEPKLEAKVNPNYQKTKYQFEYSTEAEGEELRGQINVVHDVEELPAVFEELLAGPAALTGLEPGPTYFYRIAATNATGTTDGPVQSFQALAVPAVSLNSVGETTRTTAVVSGRVIAQGLPTTYHFAYIPQAAYEAALAAHAADPYAGGRTTEELPIEADYTTHTVVGTLEELSPGTVYHYELRADNELGTSVLGPGGTFTTSSPTPPIATTGGAEAGQLTAKIQGNVDTRGLPTNTAFELGTAAYAGSLLPVNPTSSSGNALQLSLDISTGLLPGTTYYYRVVATNMDGTAYGAEQSFTTSPQPPSSTILTAPAFVPYKSIAELDSQEAKEAPKAPAPTPTRAQKLAKALKACAKRPKKQRASCKRQAHKKYPPTKKK